MEAIGGNAAARLQSLVQRIERLEGEKAALSEDIKEIFGEAKSAGYNVPVLRALIAERRKGAAAAEERRTLLEVYRDALGDLADLPLGQAAMAAA